MGRFLFFSGKVKNLKLKWARTSPERYISFLRKSGCEIGENVVFFGRIKNARIDVTRPSLITIGNNVSFNDGITIMTHDFTSWCFRYKYGDFINSSGAVRIGNNVGCGRNVTILKGVTIGDNCFIGANSTVTRDIPANTIAAGTPAKPVCSLEKYYFKRKLKSIDEAFEYARSIQERFHRRPVVDDFWEEFPLFVDKNNINDYPSLPYKHQLGGIYPIWLENHKKTFNGFDDFLKAAGIE